MHPLGGLPPFLIGWLIALLAGGGAVVWLLRRAQLRATQIAAVLAVMVLSIVVGAKGLALVETWVEAPERFASLAVLRSPHMRIPGGFLLAVLAGPLVARAIGTPFWQLADLVAPAAGLSIAGIRLGCFLQGCCHGAPSSLPWAVSFPPHTPAFWWQIQHGLIDPNATASLPVHPLQLYFAATGILLFTVLLWYHGRRRYDGEVLLLFLLAFSWSTWALEFLRAAPHATTRTAVLVAAVATSAVAASGERRRRAALLRASAANGPS